jgi:NADPH:quinone reductase-like Zn-dependent oxidoreductase
MRALTLEKYGPVHSMKIQDLPVVEPKKGEVRIRVHASALNPSDFKVATGEVKFLHARNFPMVLGWDFSGVIEAVGEGTEFKVGDAVFGFLPYGPFNKRGAFAETLIASAAEIALKPASVSHFQAAAAATIGVTAIQGMRDQGKLSSGGRVLITGVSGGVGSIAISIAEKFGATSVAIGSGGGLTLAKQLGATEVVDRKKQDVFTTVKAPFDTIFDAAAGYRWNQWKGKLKPHGIYVTTLPAMSTFIDKLKSIGTPSGVSFVAVKSKPADLKLLASWLEAGMTVAIDSTIPVREITKSLMKLQRGEIVGRVVVDVTQGF